MQELRLDAIGLHHGRARDDRARFTFLAKSAFSIGLQQLQWLELRGVCIVRAEMVQPNPTT
jgi:hypothetical protein